MTAPASRAVVERRHSPLDELDLFPTPPWATRAFLHEWLIPLSRDHGGAACGIWEPAAGLGHMAGVLAEYFERVHATDVHDWGPGFGLGSFVGGDLAPRAACPFTPAWIVTNPPFNEALAFARRALETATQGVALLCRSNWVEGEERYLDLFSSRPPSYIVQYAERVPMVKGRWDPEASTATAYAWFVWDRHAEPGTRYHWLPYGQKRLWTLPSDRVRYAPAPAATAAEAPLFGEGAP